MRSFTRAYHSITRFFIAVNTQQKTGSIVNCLHPHTLQTGISVRLLSKNVTHSEISESKVISPLSESPVLHQYSESLEWSNMKDKGKKRKDGSSSGIKKKDLKCKGKKHTQRSKARSSHSMASARSVFLGGSDDSDDIVIVFEAKRILPKSRHSQLQSNLEDDSSSVNSMELIPVRDIPLPGEIKNAVDVSSIPLPHEDMKMLKEATAQIPDDSKPDSKVLDRSKIMNTHERSPQQVQDEDSQNDVLHCDYENEVKEETARLQAIRKWEHSSYGHRLEYSGGENEEGMIFTVMSYNVLSQKLLESHRSLYRYHDARTLTWEHRSRTLMNEFRAADADVLCLQEVQEDHLAWYNSQLSELGYEGIYKKRTNQHSDGCAIYYKSHRFRLMESSSVEYYQPGVHVLDRHNVGLVARFGAIGFEGITENLSERTRCEGFLDGDWLAVTIPPITVQESLTSRHFTLPSEYAPIHISEEIKPDFKFGVKLKKRIQFIKSKCAPIYSGRNNQFVVATTHLLFNPRRHDVKLAQMQLLLAEMERICYHEIDEASGRPEYRPLILTGDLNLQPYSAVYQFLTDGFINYSILSERTLQPIQYGFTQEALLPPDLHVSNECQHVHVVSRRQFRRRVTEEGLREELRLLGLYNADNINQLRKHERSKASGPVRDSVPNAGFDAGSGSGFGFGFNNGASTSRFADDAYYGFETGILSHCFHLKSVYDHEKRLSSMCSLKEATTCQEQWVTVDYIFYSGCWNERLQKPTEGPLMLLSRFGLPTEEQCREGIKHIPNMSCGSDHLPLMARFLLRR